MEPPEVTSQNTNTITTQHSTRTNPLYCAFQDSGVPPRRRNMKPGRGYIRSSVTRLLSVAPLGYLLSSLVAPWVALLGVTLLSITHVVRHVVRVAGTNGAYAAFSVMATQCGVRGRVCCGWGRGRGLERRCGRKPGRGCGCRLGGPSCGGGALS